MYIESIYHMPSLNRLHRHNQMSVLRLSIPRSDSSHSAEHFYLPGRLHFYLFVIVLRGLSCNELREEEMGQNKTWRPRDIFS